MRADPDDLLLLPGYGFSADDRVVYQAIADTTKMPSRPRRLPPQATADVGIVDVVSTENLPYSLTIKLPQVLRRDQSYALWVRTKSGKWSEPLMINDARPLWITPASVYSTKSIASLPRDIKVVGRNLQSGPGQATRIRLTGPISLVAAAITDARSSPTIDHYVARLRLPPYLPAGRYRIEVSRDGVSWVMLPGQQLEVRPDPPPVAQYDVGDPMFGYCRPDDDSDDTVCILKAVAAAKRAGGGTVHFGPGTWDLKDGVIPGLVRSAGILVPEGINLLGEGADMTRLVRHSTWNADPQSAVLTLFGHNLISGFTFHDVELHRPKETGGPFLQLGEYFEHVNSETSASATSVEEITITGNTFDRTYVAIASGGLPIDHLFVTHNIFGAYTAALELQGNRFNMSYKYRIDDSVFDYNTFKPGSWLDVSARQGVLASELGAGARVDFSSNTADGTSTDFLNQPGDPGGWRAAFFWDLNNNQEEVLVSQNVASCTGDKIGDGEAIAYDGNGNTFALSSVRAVAGATRASVTISGPLATRQNNRDVPVGSYYVGHWVQVASGPGLGQVRKITAYTTDPRSHQTTFGVAPDWDVLPEPVASRIAVGREYWQVYTLDNLVDHRKPPCQKGNRSRRDGGGIGLWTQVADSVVEGNRQFDTDGILLQQNYIVPEHPCDNCTMESFFQSFVEIRANTIDGEYDWDVDCSASGIAVGIAAAPWNDALPPTVGYGVSISHNTIRRADAARGGAIAQMESWYSGPAPQRWPLSDNLLIHHNSIEDIDGRRAVPMCSSGHPRMGIAFPHSDIAHADTAWRTVLYANSCTHVSMPVGSGGVDIVRVCTSPAADSCECAPRLER